MTPITMQGNLVADPHRTTTMSGLAMTKFRIASTNRRLDRESGEWRDGDTTFMSVTCWRRLAEHVHLSLRKGDSVVVTGRLRFNEYDPGDGSRRQSFEIEAFGVGPDLARWPVSVQRTSRQPAAEPPAAPSIPTQHAPDEETNPWGEPVTESAA
jgi:single-strand DNA-binding protein